MAKTSNFTSGRISSDLADLDQLHAQHGWLPGSSQVRPRPEDIERKHIFLENVYQTYATFADSILITVFELDVHETDEGLAAKDTDLYAEEKARVSFVNVPFPYQVRDGTNHSCIWYTMHHLKRDVAEGDSVYEYFLRLLTDETINSDIRQLLIQRHPEVSPASLQFAWCARRE